MQSTEYKIFDTIKKNKRGTLIFPEDFYAFGSPEAIRLALHRLEKENHIKRVAHGIYLRPIISKYIGEGSCLRQKMWQKALQKEIVFG